MPGPAIIGQYILLFAGIGKPTALKQTGGGVCNLTRPVVLVYGTAF
jgi:hypothetical protein